MTCTSMIIICLMIMYDYSTIENSFSSSFNFFNAQPQNVVFSSYLVHGCMISNPIMSELLPSSFSDASIFWYPLCICSNIGSVGKHVNTSAILQHNAADPWSWSADFLDTYHCSFPAQFYAVCNAATFYQCLYPSFAFF